MTKYNPDIVQQFAKMFKEGSNRTDACLMAGIHYETFCRWMEKESEFSEAVKKAEADFKNGLITLIQKAAITQWQAGAWLLERKYHLEYALKKDPISEDVEVPRRMAERAHELLTKLEKKTDAQPPTVHA